MALYYAVNESIIRVVVVFNAFLLKDLKTRVKSRLFIPLHTKRICSLLTLLNPFSSAKLCNLLLKAV